MPGGRPRRDDARPHPELAELAAWFRAALVAAGYSSVNAFVQRHPFDKNRVYGLLNGTRLLPLEACQAVAVALRRGAEEIDPLWWRAKQAAERAHARQHHDAGQVTSWAALPWPPVALQDILEAQAQADDQLPYRLLGVEPPPLSAVYVRQQARTQPAGGKPDRPETRPETPTDREVTPLEKAIPITAALDRHEHLVITGEPGAGKSTFSQFLVLRLGEIWLRTATAEHPQIAEPVVPIRVPARTLVGARSWAGGLAVAVQATLGMRLVSEPHAALFERRLLGARWLIIVDGLDEIVDRPARAEVIQALAARCRPGGDYRIVVTTRQLPDAEFALLRSPHVQTYAVEPFGRDELREFAVQWFTAQRLPDPPADAARFLRQTGDGRLRELVRNPLLATIAAISYTLDPDRPLPSSRLDLYERFLEHLLDEDSGGRDTIAELRRISAGRPARRQFVDWLHESRLDLLRHLGRVRLAGEEPLQEAALAWADASAPAGLARPSGRAEDIRAILIGTGLLMYEGDRLRFLHHSFAEFLAAQGHAARVGPDFDGLDGWIAKGVRPAEREFVLFLLVNWSRRPGHDVDVVVDRLLVGDPKRALLAGRLMAELAGQRGPSRARVLDRIFGLALFHATRTQSSGPGADPASIEGLIEVEVDAIADVLGEFVDDPEVIGRLRAIADDELLPPTTRILAVRALGTCDDPASALQRLTALAAPMRGFDLFAAARAAVVIGPDVELGRTLLERLCRDGAAYPGLRADAAAELAGLGDSPVAAATARELAFDHRVAVEQLRKAVEVWLESLPAEGGERASAAERLLGRCGLTARQQAAIVEALLKAGLPAEADRLGMAAMHRLADAGYQAQPMVAAWMRPGHRHLAEVIELIRSPGDPRGRGYALRGLADTGCTQETAALAREIILDAGVDGYAVGLAVTSWLTALGEAALEDVLQTIGDQQFAGLRWSADVVAAFNDAGFPGAAADAARRYVGLLAGDPWDARECVSAWLAASGPEAADTILAVLEQSGSLPLRTRSVVGQAFATHGCLEQAERMAAGIIDLPDINPYEIAPATKAVVLARGQAGAEQAARAVVDRDLSSSDRVVVAEHVAAAGHLDVAQRLWCGVLTRPSAPLAWLAVAVDRLVSTGGTARGLAAVGQHDDPVVAGRAGLVRAAAGTSAARYDGGHR